MRLLIDIGHPAHVHLFRNLAKEMEQKGHTVLFTCREKECTLDLLKSYGFAVRSFGPPFRSSIGKVWGLLVFNLRMLLTLIRFRPEITLGHGSIYAAQMSWLLGIPHISMEDTGNMEQIRLYKPFTKAILVPASFHRELGKKQVKYPGNHELAYLHPVRFSPDSAILQQLKVIPGEPYVLLRFVAWGASHDKGHKGLSLQNKMKAIAAFSNHAKVFISSEATLTPEFASYKLSVPPEKIHDVIAGASLLYGESATMASEAAVLGIPAIYLDDTGRCYTTEEEEKYGLVFNFSESPEDQEKSIAKGVEILTKKNAGEEFQERRRQLLNDKIDVTAFLCWFLENWPQSFDSLKENDAIYSDFSAYNN